MASDELTATFSFREGGTARWKSPELFDPEKFGLRERRPTKESDCYALGMVIYELLSGQKPFSASAHDDPCVDEYLGTFTECIER